MKDKTDVVIHINEALDNEHRQKLSSDVTHFEGVISADLKEKRPHLMIVAFNPLKTQTLKVLAGVRDTGMHAQLVGWL